MSRLSSVANKFATVIGAAFAFGKVAQFGIESLEAASDFEAMEAQFSQVFGNLETTASGSLQKIAKQTGIVEEQQLLEKRQEWTLHHLWSLQTDPW